MKESFNVSQASSKSMGQIEVWKGVITIMNKFCCEVQKQKGCEWEEDSVVELVVPVVVIDKELHHKWLLS